MAELPPGDFTRSDVWPKLVYGQPDKLDVIEAQNQTLASHQVNEAKKRQEWEVAYENKMEKMKAFLIKIAVNEGVDIDASELRSPTKRGSKRHHAPSAAVRIDKDAAEAILELTRAFAQKYPKKLAYSKSHSKHEEFIRDWRGFIDGKIHNDFKEEWKSLVDKDQHKPLYFSGLKTIKEESRKKSRTAESTGEGAASAERSGAKEGPPSKNTRSRSDRSGNGSGSGL